MKVKQKGENTMGYNAMNEILKQIQELKAEVESMKASR